MSVSSRAYQIMCEAYRGVLHRMQYQEAVRNSMWAILHCGGPASPSHIVEPLEVRMMLNAAVPDLGSAPDNLAATIVQAHRIDLAWTDNSTNETAFEVDRSTASDFGSNLTMVEVAADATSYSDTSVTPGTSRRMRLTSA